MTEPIDSDGDYVRRVAFRDSSWKQHAACRDVGADANRMFCSQEQDVFVVAGQTLTGLDVQKYVVDRWCLGCKVQWECAREACENDEPIGAWSMTLRDRNWLMKQPNPFGIIDAARLDRMPVSVAIATRRASLRTHPVMRQRRSAAV